MKFYRWADTNAPGLYQTLSVYKCRGGFGGLLKCIEKLILRILLDVSQGSRTDLLPLQVPLPLFADTGAGVVFEGGVEQRGPVDRGGAVFEPVRERPEARSGSGGLPCRTFFRLLI